jgi:hypothetical protein
VLALVFISIFRRALCYNLAMSGKKSKGERNSNRQNGKAVKKHPKMFDPAKRRLVNA